MATADVIRATHLEVTAGMELLDSNDVLVADLSDELVGGRVKRSNFASIHGTMECDLLTNLSWTSARLRPTLTLTNLDSGESYSTNLGIFIPTSPARRTGETPETYRVQCYDKLYMLSTPRSSSYEVASGTGYIAAIEALLDELGETHVIEQSAVSKTLNSTKVWLLDERNTNLRIINDLLQSIGYRGLYMGRNGALRSEPWVSPAQRATIWDYDADSDLSVLDPIAEQQVDWHEVPNVAVFIRDDPDPALSLPTEGDGIYTITNQSDGPASIDMRGFQVVAGPYRVDAADQASLVTYGDRIWEGLQEPREGLQVATSPNPLHWHAEVVRLSWSALGYTSQRFTEISWELPLDGGDMKHEWRKT